MFLASSPPLWVRGAGAGAGAAVAAVAVDAGSRLVPASWVRAAARSRVRWCAYLGAGGVAAATAGPWVVLILLLCGLCELGVHAALREQAGATRLVPLPVLATTGLFGGGLLSVAWVAFKVGALSYGGGFVIVPLMQGDAVGRYHWLTSSQFLNAVALGQVTPGPVVHTVVAVGYGAAGMRGALLAAVVAFAPSFAFVLLGGPHFARIRTSPWAQAFLDGAGPAAVGAIFGSAVALARVLTEPWQYAVLAGAAALLLVLRRGVVVTLLAGAAVGIVVAGAGGHIP